jgi:hypothetical protein
MARDNSLLHAAENGSFATEPLSAYIRIDNLGKLTSRFSCTRLRDCRSH